MRFGFSAEALRQWQRRNHPTLRRPIQSNGGPVTLFSIEDLERMARAIRA